MLLSEALEAFAQYQTSIERSPRTIRGYAQDLSVFRRYLDSQWNTSVYVNDIRTEDVETFLLYLKERGTKKSTRKRYLGSIRSFCKWALSREILTEDIAGKLEPIKVHIPERRYLTEEEVETFIDSIDHRLVKVAVQIMYHTGLRVSECVGLKTNHVDLEDRLVRVVAGKGSKHRVVPIRDRLHDILMDYETWRVTSEYYLATKKTGRLSIVRVGAVIRETVAKLGWEKGSVTAHSFRHAFASHLVHRDVNLVNISKLLGHSSLNTTSIYTHARLDDLREAVNVL